MNEQNPLMVGLQALGWDAARIAAALAVAAPKDLHIVQVTLLKADDAFQRQTDWHRCPPVTQAPPGAI